MIVTWNQHPNQAGDWCPHSGTDVTPAELAKDAPRCPAACPTSAPEQLPVDADADTDPHHACPTHQPDSKRFVVIYEADCDADTAPPGIAAPVKAHRHVVLMTEDEVSRMLDLADVDQADGVVAILHMGADGTLQKVTAGAEDRVDSDEEQPFMYATSKLTTAGGLVVGHVHHTDH